MKSALIIIFLTISTVVSATTYYIDPAGKDGNTGTISSPWKTLAYACSKVTASGDIIHVNAGNYIETSQSVLVVGVSIEGAGVNSVIQSRIGGSSFTISLYSSKEGTNGNQHISNIKMDGCALTAYGAIKIDKRSNVEIHNCTFIDFNYYGVGFDGDGTGNQPTTYPTGNKFHDNTVINCSGYFPAGEKVIGDGKYAVGVNGQDGLLIYNNILTQTSRPLGNNGYLIKGVAGYNKGVKIYNNTISKAPYDNLTWDFAIELWLSRGGIEIYNNKITGGSIDVSGSSEVSGNATQKGEYDYSIWIHDNIIGPTTIGNEEGTHGILIEESAENVIIERNYIRNVCLGVYFPLAPKTDGTGIAFNNIDIRYNVLENIGVADGGTTDGWGIYVNASSRGFTCNNFNVYNNTIIGHVGAKLNYWGISIPNIGTVTNVNIINNIVTNFSESPIKGVGATGVSVDNLHIENNIFYNNGNSNLPKYSGLTPTNNTTRNNIISNPVFVSSSDFHPQAGSPAIGKGLSIKGLTTDYDGNTINDPPSIGAYEGSAAASQQVLPVVDNNSADQNIPPIISILNPLKGNAYENLSSVEIDAIASDPDGTINKVEFFNGPIKLVELTSAPYTYIWKDVHSGSYSITAIAIDNLNDTTISLPVEFYVGIRTKYDVNSDIVKLYPNPNNGYFTIEFISPLQSEKGEIIISDLAGKQVYNSTLKKEESSKQFDLSDIKSGIYVMMIMDKELLVTKKFIKN